MIAMHRGLLGVGFATMMSACFVSHDEPVEGTGATGECTLDLDCAESDQTCSTSQCVGGKCTSTNAPEGAAPQGGSEAFNCTRTVCDGMGKTTTVADDSVPPASTDAEPCHQIVCQAGVAVSVATPNVTSDSDPGDCMETTCDATGMPEATPDPSDVPTDVAHDCMKPGCSPAGMPTSTPDPTDLPTQETGDCQTAGCDASGNTTMTADNSDPPAATTCMTFACASGKAVGTPQNPTANCSDYGFVCGADGLCTTCPTPDAACTDPGPGAAARTPTSAYDFGGIGHCDSGGRNFCGALNAGQTAYFTWKDDGTGPFCDFDPYIEVKPQGAVTLCEYSDNCSSLTCPAGTTASTLGSANGCCLAASAGDYQGFAFPACAGGRLYATVTPASASCTGYDLEFND